MENNLLEATKTTRVMNAVGAGSADENSDSVDMKDFESVMFVASIGTLTGTQITDMKAQQSSDDASADAFADLEGTQTDAMADSDSDQVIILDIVRPRERYVRAVLERGTANAVIDGIVAIQYNPRKLPTTQDATTVQTSLTVESPAEGTA